MKIIPKKQKGGSFDSFFTTYIPLSMQKSRTHTYRESQQKTSKSSESSSDDTKGKLTERDFFDMLKGINGLPNEMSSIVGNLVSTFQMSNLTGIDPGNLATQYLQNLYQIKVAAQNKETYDKAVEQANKNGAMAEPAISIDGKIIVQKNDGQITKVSLDSYFKNNGEFTPLTVSNLANLRAYSPELAYKPEVFSIITNSMGFEAFQELLSKATKSLGTSEYTRSGMFSAEGQASKGLELLSTLRKDDRIQAIGSVTAEGLYKYKIIDKNQLGQIKALTSYISTVLPDRAKTWAALKVGTPNKEKATENLIFQYLISGNTQSHSFDVDYQGSLDKSSSSSKSDENTDNVGDDIVNNTATKWLRGLGVQNVFTINPGTNYATQVLANTLPLTDGNKQYLGANSVLQQATQGEYAGILNFNSASMGMQKIDPSNFGKIVLTDGKISSIDFPSKVLEDGTIVPDLSPKTSKAKYSADREIKQLGIDLSSVSSIASNYKTINDIYAKYGLSPAYNSDGTPTNNWTRFGVINASASNGALGMGQFDSNQLLQVINDDAVVDNLLQITKEENYDKNEWYDWNGVDHFYKGTVWIPVDVSYVAASANNGMKTEQLNDIITREAALNASKMLTKEKK